MVVNRNDQGHLFEWEVSTVSSENEWFRQTEPIIEGGNNNTCLWIEHLLQIWSRYLSQGANLLLLQNVEVFVGHSSLSLGYLHSPTNALINQCCYPLQPYKGTIQHLPNSRLSHAWWEAKQCYHAQPWQPQKEVNFQKLSATHGNWTNEQQATRAFTLKGLSSRSPMQLVLAPCWMRNLTISSLRFAAAKLCKKQ